MTGLTGPKDTLPAPPPSQDDEELYEGTPSGTFEVATTQQTILARMNERMAKGLPAFDRIECEPMAFTLDLDVEDTWPPVNSEGFETGREEGE